MVGRVVLCVLFSASVLSAQTAPPAPAPRPTGDDDGMTKPSPVPGATAESHHKAHKAPPPAVLPPLPAGPLSQMPMDQIPPTPAKVTFQSGLLTISAQNSTLGEILRDVRKLTGASIEFPLGTNGANEHVVTHLGPAAPRDVLVGLLNGSSFNYVMLGTNADPKAVASVILTPKEPAAGQTQTAANVYQGNQGAMPGGRVPGGRQPFNPQGGAGAAGPGNVPGNAVTPAEGDEPTPEEPEVPEDNADDQSQPGQVVQPDVDASQVPQDPNQPNAGPKTPEQILEMLRRPQQPGNNPPQPSPEPPEQ